MVSKFKGTAHLSRRWSIATRLVQHPYYAYCINPNDPVLCIGEVIFFGIVSLSLSPIGSPSKGFWFGTKIFWGCFHGYQYAMVYRSIQLKCGVRYGTLQPKNGVVFLQRTNHCSFTPYLCSARACAYSVHPYAHIPTINSYHIIVVFPYGRYCYLYF
jgi:hypothetical protein